MSESGYMDESPGCLLILFALAVSIPVQFWRAYVLVVLWAWFAQPLGAPALSLFPALGVCVLVGFLLSRHDYEKQTRSRLVEATVFGLLNPGFSLLTGWVVVLLGGLR